MAAVPGILAEFDTLITAVLQACRVHYRTRLVALAVFGSVGRGTPRPDSDIDLLLVADPLPQGRVARVDEFGAVEAAAVPFLQAARRAGVDASLSPVLKTPEEIRHGDRSAT
jgi:predicted nucleotidyltransferase